METISIIPTSALESGGDKRIPQSQVRTPKRFASFSELSFYNIHK